MEAIEQIANFRKELQTAFLKMIMGRSVELSIAGKKIIKNTGQDFFITAIADDETITLVDRNQQIFKGMKLTDIEI